MKIFLTLITLFSVYFGTKSDSIKELQFLAGTWKMEHKENYETWKVNKDQSMEGNAYKQNAGNKNITEYLTIQLMDGNIVYAAKVLNQNNAQPVHFTLNKTVQGKYSFENLTHDFPKKIQYTKLNDSTLFVAVLGPDDKGFSYKMSRVK